jgi:hypothetical protein
VVSLQAYVSEFEQAESPFSSIDLHKVLDKRKRGMEVRRAGQGLAG